MRRQKCTQCGTMLDVSNLEKDSKFACSNCGSILVVGEAAKVKRSFKESGPAFRRKAAKAAKGAKGAKGATSTTPVRARRERVAPEPGSGSKMPLFIGIGVVVVVGIVAAVMMSTGNGGTEGGGGVFGGGKKSGGQTPGNWWAEKATQVAIADAATLRSWLKEAKERGYDKDEGFWAVKEHDIYKSLLKRDPDDDDANRYAGRRNLREYPGFDKVWAAMNESFTALPDEHRGFCDKYAVKVDAGRAVWLTEQAHAEATALLDSFKAWHEARLANPAAPRIEKGIRDAKTILKDFEFVAAVEGPFILLLGYDATAEDAAAKKVELEEKGSRLGKALKVFNEQFEKRFREPLQLHKVEDGRYFIQVCLSKRPDFARFLRDGEGFDVTGDVMGFFSPRTRWAGVVTTRDPADAKNIACDLGHEAAHQLHHYYGKDPKKKFTPNLFDEWTGIWFTEGFAEFLGGGLDWDPLSGDTKFTGFAKRRVEFLQGMRDNGVPLIELREVVQLQSVQAWARYVHGPWLSGLREDEDMPESAARWLGEQDGLIAKIMYAHSWYLAYFLNEYENGKYAARYRDLIRTAIRGKQKPEAYRTNKGVLERWASAYDAFQAIYGLSDAARWEAMGKEFRRFLPKMLRKAK